MLIAGHEKSMTYSLLLTLNPLSLNATLTLLFLTNFSDQISSVPKPWYVVYSKLDYCNSLHSAYSLNKSLPTDPTLVRTAVKVFKYSHVTPMLIDNVAKFLC